jgi:medium-chain acyl-[acyl-carrier-protein] hydrolase
MMKGNRWLLSSSSRERPRLRLYCLPYAGRGASLYAPWLREALPGVEICPIHIPGREARLSEPAITDLALLVAALVEALPFDGEVPYALFGHSMGGLIAFELARALQRMGAATPMALFISACPWPPAREAQPSLRDAPDSALLQRLRELNGTPSGVLDNTELMQLILPIFRADIALIETYQYAQSVPLSCPLHAFVGSADHKVTRRHMLPWAQETAGLFTLNEFTGDHYFIHTCHDALMRTLYSCLRPGRLADSPPHLPQTFEAP